MSNSQETSKLKDTTVKLTPSKISNSSTKSTSKFRNVGDFLWSKLTSSRKNSSLNISKTNSDTKILQSNIKEIIDTNNSKVEKKRRNLFHIFDSSTAKLKFSTGVNKKNIKNKTITKKNVPKYEHEVVLEPEPQKDQNLKPNKDDDLIEIDLESIKANLMDNSILKSKISAASRRNVRSRQISAKSSDSNLNLSNSYQSINIKSSFSKISTGSLAQKMEVIDENGIDLDYEKINDKSSFKNSQSSDIMSDSSAKKSTHSINIESENLDMSVQNKSGSQSSLKGDAKINDLIRIDSCDEQDMEKNKIAIYDNNITECSNYEDENNENTFDLFNPLPKELKSKSYEKIDFVQSAKPSLDSNNNYDHLNDENNCNASRNSSYLKNNRYSYFDVDKTDKIDFGSVVLKPLSHSRSLKLNQKLSESSNLDSKIPLSIKRDNLCEKKLNNANFKFSIGQFSSSYKIPNSKKRDSIISKISADKDQEPIWKELAFKKHNAWNQKNFDSQINTSPNGKTSQDRLDQNYDQVPLEGKVKSIIRDLQKA